MRLPPGRPEGKMRFTKDGTWGIWTAGTATFFMALLQPSLVVIDHGHFQYNSVCLGLAMGAAAAVSSGGRRGGEVKFDVVYSLRVFGLKRIDFE